MSGAARDFSNRRRELSSRPPPPLQGKAPKEIHAILRETWGEHAPSYATVSNMVAQFKRGDFSTCDEPVSWMTQNSGNPGDYLMKFTS